MNKKSRLITIIAVLAVCFAFLWPTISWYARTPKEDQALALSTLENIKDYSNFKAASDVKAMVAAAKADPETLVPADQEWFKEQVKKNYKLENKKYSEPLKLVDALNSFASKTELVNFVEGVYRKKILKNKDFYKNSVKLGLDLSGGMNIIVKADLDAALAKQKENSEVANPDAFKEQAMTQA